MMMDDDGWDRERAEKIGYEVVGYLNEGNWREFFLHPKQGPGIVVQLAHQVAEDDSTKLFPVEVRSRGGGGKEGRKTEREE